MKKIVKNTLSVCMIVRNEEAYLGACLSSIKQLADEIVVVDTGSDDRTIEIAHMFGARVYEYKWNDDFSAARNCSLAKAKGDWILILDADETISANDHKKLSHSFQNTSPKDSIAFLMTTRNYTEKRSSAGWIKNDYEYNEIKADGWVPTYKVRLFPNHHDIHFVYAVHEMVDPVLEEKGFHFEKCPVPVHHFGKLDKERKHQRWQTYYRIGRKKLDTLGDQPSALRELAIQAALLGHLEEAADLWLRFLHLCPNYADGWTNLASIHARLGRFRKAREAAYQAANLAPDQVEPIYNVVLSELQNGEAERAIRTCNQLLRQFPEYVQGHVIRTVSHICAGRQEVGIEQLRIVRNRTDNRMLMHMIAEIGAALRNAGRDRWVRAICEAVEKAIV